MRFTKDHAVWIAIVALGLVVAYDLRSARIGAPPAPVPAAPPASAAEVLGRSYASTLAATYADGWLAAARAIEDGETIAEAQTKLQAAWQESRTAAFRRDVVPAFSAVLPEGTEPETPEQRARVVSLWRDFAKGLKGGR
jgi:hypothetical protein